MYRLVEHKTYEVEDGIVIIPQFAGKLEPSRALFLEDSSKFIWELLKKKETNKEDIMAEICNHYDVEYKIAQRDLEGFLDELISEHFVVKE